MTLDRAAPAPLRVVLLDTIPTWGGGEQWCLDAAASLVARGHQATIAGAPRGALLERARAAGLATLAVSAGPLAGPAATLRLWRWMRARGTGVLVANTGRDLRLGAAAGLFSGARLVQRRGIARAVRRDPWTRWIYRRRVRRIVVNSRAIERTMRASAAYLGPDAFALLGNGVDLSAAEHGDRARFRAAAGLSPAAPVAAVVGRLAPMKGHAHLLDAWPAVRARVPGAVLCVAGEGELEAELGRRAAQLGLGDGVRFLGFRRDLADLYRGVDLFVLPSVRDEGASHALLEAMAAGLAAVVTDCGGLVETVEPGTTARVVPVADPAALAGALAGLLADPAERARLGRNARARAVERHDPALLAAELEALLYEVVAGTEAPSR